MASKPSAPDPRQAIAALQKKLDDLGPMPKDEPSLIGSANALRRSEYLAAKSQAQSELIEAYSQHAAVLGQAVQAARRTLKQMLGAPSRPAARKRRAAPKRAAKKRRPSKRARPLRKKRPAKRAVQKRR